jgi:hypothetical protein
MPPMGWKKPPGSTAYARKAPNKPRSSNKRFRTAGAHMLAAGLGNGVGPAHPLTSADQASEDGAVVEADDEEEAQDDVDTAGDGQGPPSKRLRLRKGAPAQAEDDDVNAAADSDIDMPGLEENRSSGEESEAAQSQSNTAAARARRAGNARVLEDDGDDPLEDVRPTTRAENMYGPPFNQELHLLDLSVTLSKSKGHINPAWLTLVHEWMKLRCEAGAVASERGGKAQHLHLQIMLRMRIAPMDIEQLKLELKTLVGWRRGDGSGCYCQAKQFGVGQVGNTHSHPGCV